METLHKSSETKDEKAHSVMKISNIVNEIASNKSFWNLSWMNFLHMARVESFNAKCYLIGFSFLWTSRKEKIVLNNFKSEKVWWENLKVCRINKISHLVASYLRNCRVNDGVFYERKATLSDNLSPQLWMSPQFSRKKALQFKGKLRNYTYD